MRALADTVGDSDQRGFLRTRGGNKSGLPGELQVEAVVGATDQEYHAKVTCTNVQRRDQDGTAGGGENYGDHDVVAGFLEAS